MAELDASSIVYEEHLLRDPFSLSAWLNYLDYAGEAPLATRWQLYERAVARLPGSYKLWMKYMKERVSHTRSLCLSDPTFDEVNNVFERCLVHLHKMPLVWVEYLRFLLPQYKLTRIRRTFDRSLAALAVTQHERWIWPMYLEWATTCGVVETGVRVWRRYLKINPLAQEDCIRFLKRSGRLEEAAIRLTNIVNDERFVSQRGKSRHELWSELLRLLVRNPTSMARSKRVHVDAIIRSGLDRFAHEVGKLWTALADYYIRLGQFEKSRDIYEEAIHEVKTVRDFSIVFDAYAKFEESLLNARIKEVEEATEAAEAEEMKGEEEAGNKYDLTIASLNLSSLSLDSADELVLDWYSSEGAITAKQHPDLLDLDIDLSMARLDSLLARRPLLLSSVILRQNPHHVNEWLHRVSLFPDDPLKQVEVYSEAVRTVDPQLANNGKLERLWVAFARFYESHDDLDNARIIFQRGGQVKFRTVDALLTIWTEYVEMELRHGQYGQAMNAIKQALTLPKGLNRQHLAAWGSDGTEDNPKKSGATSGESQQAPVHHKLYKSPKLWSLYADLEENFGTLDSTKAVYEQMLFLRVITPQILLSYAQLLWDRKFFEECFRVYEKGVAIFTYPHVYPIWLVYLHRFMERYGDAKGGQRKLERIRDLFEECLKSMPADCVETKKIYLMYAKYEEEKGLARRAMTIYQRACEAAPMADRYELYLVYLARCALRFGVARTRPIYEGAIKKLPDAHVKSTCLKYASLEKRLGEIDRARAIYSYGSQFADPRVDNLYWQTWADFEVSHGNQETFKEMLRIKRTVMATFAALSIVPSTAPLTPANSILQPSRAPGAKERQEKLARRQEERGRELAAVEAARRESEEAERVAGKKRRYEEEAEEEEEKEVAPMGAAARIASAREQQTKAQSAAAASMAEAPGSVQEGEIDIDNLEAEEVEKEEEEITVKPVPDAVFGLTDAK